MTKPLKHEYQIQYIDNTYRIVDWTNAEFIKIGEAIAEGKHALVLKEGIFVLNDIRAVVYIPPVPIEESKEEEQPTQFDEWGFIQDPEMIESLKEFGLIGDGKR